MGGNWVVFLLSWLVVSAIISAFEHNHQEEVHTREEKNKEDIKAMTAALNTMKEKFESDTAVSEQLAKIIKTMEDPAFAELWGKMDLNLEVALAKHNLVETVVDIVRDEVVRIKANLTEDDVNGKDTANKLIKLLSEDTTVTLLKEY